MTESEWRPIATAPKDGQPIILGRAGNDDVCPFSGQGRWYEEDHDGPDNMGHDAGFLDDEFQFFRCARSFGNPAYQSTGTQPTHWMPLPKPPNTDQPEDKEGCEHGCEKSCRSDLLGVECPAVIFRG